jgi:hypothetical protein
MGKVKRTKEKRITSLNANFALNLMEVYDKVIQQISFLEEAKLTKSELPIDGHIASWEAFKGRLDVALAKQPEIQQFKTKEKLPKLAVGDYFYTKQSGIIYKVVEVIKTTNQVSGINKLQFMGATNKIKAHLSNVIISNKKDYKQQHKEEETPMGKITKSKKGKKNKSKKKKK